MYKVVLHSLLFIIFSQGLSAQSFKAKVSGSLDFHLKQTQNQNYPPFDNQVEYPSIASFFNNNAGLNIDFSCRFRGADEEKGKFFVGFSFEYTKSNSKSKNPSSVFGSALYQNKYSIYAGYGGYIDFDRYYTFLYGLWGITLKDYEGEGTFILGNRRFTAEYKYSNSAAFRVGGGIDFENINDSPLTIGISLYFDIGSISRSALHIHGDNISEVELYPSGESDLYDNTFYIAFSAGYQLNL